jgi:hypothetical protein
VTNAQLDTIQYSQRDAKKQKIKMEAISCLSENFAACFNTFILKGIIQLDNIQKKKTLP